MRALAPLVLGFGLLAAAVSAAPSPVPPETLQMVLVTSPSWEASKGTLRTFERCGPEADWQPQGEALEVNLGRHGMGWGRGLHPPGGPGPEKREGDGRAPAGVFRLSAVFGDRDPRPSEDGLPYLETTEWLECVDDVDSRWYNRIVDRMQVGIFDWRSSERMRIEPYRVGIVVDHNADGPQPGAGSCIFLHIRQGPDVATSGCTAAEEAPMAALAAWLQREARPVLVQLPDPEHARLRGPWRLP